MLKDFYRHVVVLVILLSSVIHSIIAHYFVIQYFKNGQH